MWLANNAPGVSELGNWMFSSNAGEQAAHSAGQNAGNTGDPGDYDPNKWGTAQEQQLREALSKTYNQVYGATDAEIRRGLGITGKTADFLGYNAQQNRWLIAESKGGDLDKAFKQLTNTANGLLNKAPDAVGKLDLRIYMNQTQYNKLVQGGLPGWRVQDGFLGWIDEAEQWVYATVNGVRISVQAAK